MDETLSILQMALEDLNPGVPILVILGIGMLILAYRYTWLTITAGGAMACFWAATTLNNAEPAEESIVPLFMIGFAVIGFVCMCFCFYGFLFKEST